MWAWHFYRVKVCTAWPGVCSLDDTLPYRTSADMSTLVPTLCWVPKGVSKEHPVKARGSICDSNWSECVFFLAKVELSPDKVQQLLKDADRQLKWVVWEMVWLWWHDTRPDQEKIHSWKKKDDAQRSKTNSWIYTAPDRQPIWWSNQTTQCN